MKKLLFLLLTFTIILSMSPDIFAKAYRSDPNTLKWTYGPDPLDSSKQVWYAFNDWTWVSGSLQLDSAWPGDPDTYPWPIVPPDTFNSALMALQISAPANIVGSTIVPTGYQFDLASAGITGKVISKITIVNAYWGFPVDPYRAVAPAFYDEDNNLVYQGNPPTGWWQGVNIDFSNYPTKKVTFVINPFAAKWVWAGNSMYLEQVTMTLINQSQAKCGTKYKPYPSADLNGDCIANFADMSVLAQYWLKCNDPTIPACVP